MVKIEKPKPKTLTKKVGLEGVTKKKKQDKALSKSSKPIATEKQKEKLIKEIVQEGKVVKPVKKSKDIKPKHDTKPSKQTPSKALKITQNVTQEKVLPPPITALPKKGKKSNLSGQNNEKKTSVATTSATLEKVQKKNKKKQSDPVQKRPLILAPSVSPSPAKAKLPKALAVDKKIADKKRQQEKPTVKGKVNKATKFIKDDVQKKQISSAEREVKPTKSTIIAKDPITGRVKRAGPHTKQQETNFNKKKFKKISKETKVKKVLPHVYDPVAFDEDKFNSIVNVDNIRKLAEALKVQVEQEVAKKKISIFSDYRYFLNLAYFKIPSVPKRMVKLSLKHSLVDKEDDVVIIVPDLQRGSKVDYDPTIAHYTDLFREAGIEAKLKIIPFNQLRKEYNTFEAMRKFSNSYEYFMCDGRIVGHVTGICGKVFQKPRCTIHSVRLDNSKTIKTEIEKSLKRTAYRQLQKGDLIAIPIGNHKFTSTQLSENVDYVIGQLKTQLPGGLGNVRNLHLRIDILGTSSMPLYISMAQPPETTPYVTGPREERMLKMKKEANEVLSRFALTKGGDVFKLKKDQIERKRKLQEMRASLKAADSVSVKESTVEAVPAKKSHVTENSKTTGKNKRQKLVEDENIEGDNENKNNDVDEVDSNDDENEDDSNDNDDSNDDDDDDDSNDDDDEED